MKMIDDPRNLEICSVSHSGTFFSKSKKLENLPPHHESIWNEYGGIHWEKSRMPINKISKVILGISARKTVNWDQRTDQWPHKLPASIQCKWNQSNYGGNVECAIRRRGRWQPRSHRKKKNRSWSHHQVNALRRARTRARTDAASPWLPGSSMVRRSTCSCWRFCICPTRSMAPCMCAHLGRNHRKWNSEQWQ